MDERMQGSWVGYAARKRTDGVIWVSFFHRGRHFYFLEDDEDAENMYDEPLTEQVLDEFDRNPRAMYQETEVRYAGIVKRMDEKLGIEEEPKREAPVKRETKPTPVTRVAPLEREDGQMRLF